VIKLGKISGVFGVKGWIKVYSHTSPREGITNYSPWVLKGRGDDQVVDVLQGQPQGKTIVARLDGVDDRNKAETLIGLDIYVQREQLNSLPAGEYYWSDLEGLKVYNLADEYLGIVDYLIETGANDVLIVKGDDNQEYLIPYIGHVVQTVDLQAGKMLVDWEKDF
jgi:16S rRNA processing protein RimM